MNRLGSPILLCAALALSACGVDTGDEEGESSSAGGGGQGSARVMPEAIADKLWTLSADPGETVEYVRFTPEGARVEYLDRSSQGANYSNCHALVVFGGVLPMAGDLYQRAQAAWNADGSFTVQAIAAEDQFGFSTEEIKVTDGVLHRNVLNDDGTVAFDYAYPEASGLLHTDLQVCTPSA